MAKSDRTVRVGWIRGTWLQLMCWACTNHWSLISNLAMNRNGFYRSTPEIE